MPLIDFVYAVFIALALCATYFILLSLFPTFFAQKITLPRRSPWFSLSCIIAFLALAYAISFSIQDPELNNRAVHIFGGGFAGLLTCFFAARDSRVLINKFQFFVFSALIVLALGVANELFEFILQMYGWIISSASFEDTWFDLASNAIGIVLASVCLVPLYKGEAQ